MKYMGMALWNLLMVNMIIIEFCVICRYADKFKEIGDSGWYTVCHVSIWLLITIGCIFVSLQAEYVENIMKSLGH